MSKNNTIVKVKKDHKNGKAYLVSTTEIHMNSNGEIMYGISFESGGWNTVWAKNDKQALSRAKAEYGQYGIRDVYVMLPDTYDSLLRAFY